MSKQAPDIYLYGQILLSTVHILQNEYPKGDSYAEIAETFQIPGGETANAAFILSNLGYKTRINGPFLGHKTKDTITKYCEKYGVDYSQLVYSETFAGVEDLILIDKHSRTIFGKFQQYFSGDKKWGRPDKKSVEEAKIVSIDPFFKEESDAVASFCSNLKKDYITIDCPFSSFMHQHSAANVISAEYIQNAYANADVYELFHQYTSTSNGLVIFTFGKKEILYGRKNSELKIFRPYALEARGTLGAGDIFRAGVIYGVLNQFDDEKTVKFAAATAALACKNFPFVLSPPSLQDILDLTSK